MRKNEPTIETYHGSPYDRGQADCYNERPCDPHKYPEGTYNGRKVPKEELTAGEIRAYMIGYTGRYVELNNGK
jgi:hypothetical protein